ncbi:hypothetical protein AB4212_58450, partial [Streptomyces sp. 2MCAF27]
MHDVRTVQLSERGAQSGAESPYRPLRERAAEGHGVVEGRAEHVLGGQPRDGCEGIGIDDLGAVPLT